MSTQQAFIWIYEWRSVSGKLFYRLLSFWNGLGHFELSPLSGRHSCFDIRADKLPACSNKPVWGSSSGGSDRSSKAFGIDWNFRKRKTRVSCFVTKSKTDARHRQCVGMKKAQKTVTASEREENLKLQKSDELGWKINASSPWNPCLLTHIRSRQVYLACFVQVESGDRTGNLSTAKQLILRLLFYVILTYFTLKKKKFSLLLATFTFLLCVLAMSPDQSPFANQIKMLILHIISFKLGINVFIYVHWAKTRQHGEINRLRHESKVALSDATFCMWV